MRVISKIGFCFLAGFLSGCGVKQSICMDDPFNLMSEVFVSNCEGRFDLAAEDKFYWGSQDEIPSKCDYINVTGIDELGNTYSYRQYKNDVFQSASSGEFIISAENEIELNWLFMSGKARGETCVEQIKRHRQRQTELREKFGPRPVGPQDYEIIPLEK